MKTVMIQKGILSDLKTFIDEYNQTHKPKLKVDVAVFFISLINEVDSHYRADEKEDDYTPLYSKILKEYHSNYNKYFDFLIKYNILLKQNQNSPSPVEEQVAVIYSGINGFIDDVPVDQVKQFAVELRDYLRVSKPAYGVAFTVLTPVLHSSSFSCRCRHFYLKCSQ